MASPSVSSWDPRTMGQWITTLTHRNKQGRHARCGYPHLLSTQDPLLALLGATLPQLSDRSHVHLKAPEQHSPASPVLPTFLSGKQTFLCWCQEMFTGVDNQRHFEENRTRRDSPLYSNSYYGRVTRDLPSIDQDSALGLCPHRDSGPG